MMNHPEVSDCTHTKNSREAKNSQMFSDTKVIDGSGRIQIYQTSKLGLNLNRAIILLGSKFLKFLPK